MSTLTIEITPELDRRLREEGTRRGQPVSRVARSILEENLLAVDRSAQRERNEPAIALLDEWFQAGVAEDEGGDPLPITPLKLRGVSIE